jgi:hypothetical protein
MFLPRTDVERGWNVGVEADNGAEISSLRDWLPFCHGKAVRQLSLLKMTF